MQLASYSVKCDAVSVLHLKKRVFPWKKLVMQQVSYIDVVGVLHLECDLQSDVGRQLH
jgi:hypothetical protein